MSGPIISAGWVGRVIDGRFALHEWLGGSGRSGVFRTDLPQPVAKKAAIKLIPAEGAEADAYVSGWAKAATLSSPYLMRVFRSGRFQFGTIGLVYVVMECADEVLSQILPARALTTDETREMLGPVAEGLECLHGRGFVHGHLKPANILVVNEQLKISGDNVAASGMRNRFERPSPYDAPEAGTGVLTPASDVWSLGMTLVEALTQRTIEWDRTSSRDLAVPEEMPRVFAEIARDCLRRDPEARCSLKEIKRRLEPSRPLEFPAAKEVEAAAAAPAAVSRPVEDDEESAEESRLARTKMRVLPLALGLMAVIALFAVLMMLGHGKQGATPSTASESVPETPASPSSNDAQAPRSTAEPATANGAVLERKMPEASAQALRTIHGTVTVAVRVAVDATGRVSRATFKSEGPSEYFAKVAMEAARGWKFKPAEKNGDAVPSEWLLRFRFRQRGGEAAAIEEKP